MLDLWLPDPVNRHHALNWKRLAWYLTVPGLEGGKFWYDLMGLYPGTLSGMAAGSGWAPTYRPGGWGQLFYAGSDGVNVSPLASTFRFDECTVAVWLRETTAAANAIRALFDFRIDGNNELEITDFNGAFGLSFRWHYVAGGTSKTISTTSISGGGWNRVAVTISKSGDAFKAFLNGKQVGSTQTGLGALSASSIATSLIGNDASNEYFRGPLDDFAIWSYPLSAAAIQADYDLSRLGYPDVLNRWPSASTLYNPALIPVVTAGNPSARKRYWVGHRS